MDSKFYLNRYIFWRQQNVLRLVELILCVTCFSIAIIWFSKPLYFVTKVILLVVATSFFFITFVDVISWCLLRPMGYKTWIMIAVAAFLMFWLSAGFMIFLIRVTEQAFLIFALVLYVITGFIYLVDCFVIIIEFLEWTNNVKVGPAKQYQDKGVPTCFLFSVREPEAELVQRPRSPSLTKCSNISCRETEIHKRPVSRSPSKGKSRKPVVRSHGGTFAVARDLPPLPCPETKTQHCPCRPRKSSTSTKAPSDRDGHALVDKYVQTHIPEVTTKYTRLISERYSFYGPYSARHSDVTRMRPPSEKSRRRSQDFRPNTPIKDKTDQDKCANPQCSIYTITSSRASQSSHRESQEPLPLGHQTCKRQVSIGSRYSSDSLQLDVYEEPTRDFRHTQRGTQAAEFPSCIVLADDPVCCEEPQKPYETDEEERADCTSQEMILTSNKNYGRALSRPSLQDSIWHQYYQNPCKTCGKTHFQQQTTINGVLLDTPYYCNCREGPQPNCSKLVSKRQSSCYSSPRSSRRNGLDPC